MATVCQLHLEEVHDGLCVRFDGPELNDEIGAGLVEELDALARGHNRPHLYLDLNGVEQLSARVLTDLLKLDRKLRTVGGRLSLRNLNPLVYEVFHICRLTELLDTEGRP